MHEKIGIYLDNAATTFPKPKQVIEAMEHCLKNSCVNAGRAVYELAQQASLLVSETRASVADLLGFKTGEIIFSKRHNCILPNYFWYSMEKGRCGIYNTIRA